MALLQDPRIEAAIFHDCATPFFGIMRHNVGWDAERGSFSWLDTADRKTRLSPEFPDRYVLSPTGAANRFLAELIGEELVAVKTPTTLGFRAIASKSRVVVVNRGANPVSLRIPFPSASGETLVADAPSSCLPDAFRVIPLKVGDPDDGGAVLLPPRRVSIVRAPRRPAR